MEEGLFHNPTFVNHINEFAVAVVGHSGQHAEITRRNPKSGEEESVCPNYDTIPCSVHNACESQARGNFDFRGVPATFVCNSSGEELFKDVPRTPQGTIDMLNQAQQQMGGKPITGSQIDRWEQDLYRGDGKLAKGKFKDAIRSYNKVLESEDIPEFVRNRAQGRLEQLVERARQAIAEAAALEPSPAKRELKKLIKQFRDHDGLKEEAEQALNPLQEE